MDGKMQVTEEGQRLHGQQLTCLIQYIFVVWNNQ